MIFLQQLNNIYMSNAYVYVIESQQWFLRTACIALSVINMGHPLGALQDTGQQGGRRLAQHLPALRLVPHSRAAARGAGKDGKQEGQMSEGNREREEEQEGGQKHSAKDNGTLQSFKETQIKINIIISNIKHTNIHVNQHGLFLQ